MDHLGRHHLVGGAVVDELAEVEDVEVAADPPDEGHVVLHEEDADPVLFGHAGEDVAEAVGLRLVETR